MSKQRQVKSKKIKRKIQRKLKSATTGLSPHRPDLYHALEEGTIQAQAATLADPRLNETQQQALISQIGQAQGNQHLQRVITSVRDQKDLSTIQLASILGPIGPNLAVQRRDVDPAADEGGNPVAPPVPGTSLHPMVLRGSTGPAVEELQQKLNADGATPPLVVDGIFGPKTQAATIEFQRKHGLDPDGIAGPLTWGKMDELGLVSTVGRVERTWEENVEGHTYGMTSRYTWRILPGEIRITVNIRFVGLRRPDLVELWFNAIRTMWNRFKAVNTATSESLDVNFDPQSVTSGEDNIVRIRPGNQRSDSENWFIGDPDHIGTAQHEFGHMVGLEDEYRRTHRDYKRLTGEEPPAGQTTGDAPAADIATELHTALRGSPASGREAATQAVIDAHSLAQGNFAQEVVAAYQTAFSLNLVDDIVARVPGDDESSLVDPFLFSSKGIMGDMSDRHDHPLEPRHVREFVGYVGDVMGGEWKAEER